MVPTDLKPPQKGLYKKDIYSLFYTFKTRKLSVFTVTEGNESDGLN